jgi:hypothetical protein
MPGSEKQSPCPSPASRSFVRVQGVARRPRPALPPFHTGFPALLPRCAANFGGGWRSGTEDRGQRTEDGGQNARLRSLCGQWSVIRGRVFGAMRAPPLQGGSAALSFVLYTAVQSTREFKGNGDWKMIKIHGFGLFSTIPSEAAHIIDGDMNALKNDIKNGLDINKPIVLREHIKVAPLELAFRTNKVEIIKLLVASGANLNDKESPAFLDAVRYCNEEIVRFIAKNGANIHALNNVKSDAFSEALYGKKYKNLPVIEALGHSVRQYGGKAFRSAVWNRMYGVLDFFVKNGVDVNYNKADQVFPNKPTPLCVVPDLKMAKYLVENGADFMLADGDGMRPYNLAVEYGNQDLADYYKSLEPPQFHDTQNRLLELEKYNLPQSLIAFLMGENRRVKIDGANRYSPSYVDFFALAEAPEIKIGRQTALRLSREIDNYSILWIIWNPKTKRIAAYDEEHLELIDIAPFEAFMQNISMYVNKLIEGDPI